jgi:hypothetical protein
MVGRILNDFATTYLARADLGMSKILEFTLEKREDFLEIFDQELKYWQGKLGLDDWEICVRSSEVLDSGKEFEITVDHDEGVASIAFNTEILAEYARGKYRVMALELLLSILLTQLTYLVREEDLEESLVEAKAIIEHLADCLRGLRGPED